MKELIRPIKAGIARHPFDPRPYEDLFTVCRELEGAEKGLSHTTSGELRRLVSGVLRNSDAPASVLSDFYGLYRRTLLFDAPVDLDSYFLYLEIDRKPPERFYQPRRQVLYEAVQALQDLMDDKLDELFLSMPPRVGKTTLLMFLTTALMGRNSEASNLYSAYSDTITSAFYGGVLEIINDPVTYRWADVFPKSKVVQTNAAEEYVNLDRRKRYPTLTCRSLYGTLNGACDCNGFLISDDLIGGIEEALNKDRLNSAWSKVDNNLLPRAKEGAKILWCGTRWSLVDPAGRRRDLLTNDPRYASRRYKVINLPALNERDESNFHYPYGVGFSTEFYLQRRASFERNDDMASWNAQYQGDPIEREGALFSPADFRFFNGVLPEGAPDRVFMAVDPAFGGGDYVAAPVCCQYGEDIYVPAVVYDNGDKKVTQPLLAHAAKVWKVNAMQIEANKSTEAYADGVRERLREQGIHLNLTTKPAPSNQAKYQRIFDKAPDIRANMIFLEDGKRDKAYSQFMHSVYSYKMFGKNEHDDAPESLSMAMGMVRSGGGYKVFQRPI